MTPEPPSIRLADLLSTASSLAAFRLDAAITRQHLRDALAVLLEETTFEALGGGASPLIPRRTVPAPDADVLAFAARWNDRLGGPYVEVSPELLAELRADLESPPS
ncbi:hypothetical protein [Tepidiforma thermophila]|uniref:Uncharacterized protein n=1 Tax=Tepidiforma thermophila (strain KCTC 52669 / CGMCC 1.13589 / G233) TaxID=2761530 RepID=A0A2A9HEY6_TEPT2|nr:hypothetical protein [Tepidiforma thermophila]PFG74338.1 hypothetical protein A9A59_1557 [Tepidiforma thermophila]